MKKVFVIILAICIFFSGCTKLKKPSIYSNAKNYVEKDIDINDPDVTIKQIEAEVPTIGNANFEKKIEAEKATITGDLKISKERKNHSGTGYITNFNQNEENNIKINFNLPANEHYDISVCIASDKAENNALMVNNKEISKFKTKSTGKFEIYTFENVFLNLGNNTFEINEITGNIDFDFIHIKNSNYYNKINLKVSQSLINSRADQKTKNTMKFLTENYGKNTITGQYVSLGKNTELNLIKKVTGKYPTIRFSDFGYVTNPKSLGYNEIYKAIEWSKLGGLIGYSWHWRAPLDKPSFYTEKTAFDISKAQTSKNIASLSIDDIEKLHSQKEISSECFAIIKDIDTVSKELEKLQKANVTVLWRPLHEASGGWFWWGAKGKEPYLWLWNLMYERMTSFHKLNNLIWIWNAQDPKWYVDDDKCDIISADIYNNQSEPNSQINTFYEMYNISKKKLIAISEASSTPNINYMLRDKSMWSFFALWKGEYIQDINGNYSEAYTLKQDLINAYNHENTITLDNMPSLS